MEMELRQEYISCWDSSARIVINQEETTEMIVPDACPDILRMISGEGRLLIQRREISDGKMELGGCIRVSILYQPESGAQLCGMEAVLPFATKQDIKGATRESKVSIKQQIERVEVHVLNPRKVLVKVNFRLTLCCHTPQTMALCCGVAQTPEHCICQKCEEHQSHLTLAVQEKSFSYSDTLELPGGNADIVQILRHRIECSCKDAKVIGNKLLFKGEARIALLYLTRDARICSLQLPLPFSQMMEIGDGCEEALPEVHILFTDASCKIGDEDGRSLAVDLELIAQVQISKTERFTLLQDAYGTNCKTTDTRKKYATNRLMDYGSAPETVRALLECNRAVEAVLDIQLRLVQVRSLHEGSDLKMQAELEAFVLIRTADGDVESLQQRIIGEHLIPSLQQWDYTCDAQMGREASGSVSPSGVELAFGLDFSWTAIEKGSAEGIALLQAEDLEQNAQPAPSIVIRSVRAGECLWDVAKCYQIEADDILKANDLTAVDLFTGQMLLIPR